MKKLVASLFLAVFGAVIILTPSYAAAVNVFPSGCSDKSSNIYNTPVCQDSRDQQSANNNALFGPSGIITIIIKVLGIVVGFLAIIMIIAAGLKMILSGGDAADLKEARASLAHSLAALAVAVLAEAIVGFILSKIP
ncbi:MAG TPA: hypothetical protein VHD60_01780 [Candidatus Saccharimonadales bacterium]|nr:hypothetical protein [Candidatus Saccharimonadales bacterium]